MANDHKRVAAAMCDRFLMPFAFSHVLSPSTYYVRCLGIPEVPNATLDSVYRGSFIFFLHCIDIVHNMRRLFLIKEKQLSHNFDGIFYIFFCLVSLVSSSGFADNVESKVFYCG